MTSEFEERDAAILAKRKAGMTLAAIAAEFGISGWRVSQVVYRQERLQRRMVCEAEAAALALAESKRVEAESRVVEGLRSVPPGLALSCKNLVICDFARKGETVLMFARRSKDRHCHLALTSPASRRKNRQRGTVTVTRKTSSPQGGSFGIRNNARKKKQLVAIPLARAPSR